MTENQKPPQTEFALKCFRVPYKRQRYPTVGDWEIAYGDQATLPDGNPTITVRVSELSDPRYEQLIALHEIVEALLCRWTGVTQQQVDNWDRAWEQRNRDPNDEPGDNPACPYNAQHVIASAVERLAAKLLGVDWNRYSEELATL